MENKTKNRNVSKIVLRIFIIIYFLLTLIVSLVVFSSTIRKSDLAIGETSFYIMRSDKKNDVAQKGDLVIVKKIDANDMQEGDNIVYGDNKTFYCDNVVKIKKINTISRIIIAEKDGISYQFTENAIQGTVVKTIPNLGNIISFLRTPVGIILYIIFTICIFILLRVLVSSKKDTRNK